MNWKQRKQHNHLYILLLGYNFAQRLCVCERETDRKTDRKRQIEREADEEELTAGLSCGSKNRSASHPRVHTSPVRVPNINQFTLTWNYKNIPLVGLNTLTQCNTSKHII